MPCSINHSHPPPKNQSEPCPSVQLLMVHLVECPAHVQAASRVFSSTSIVMHLTQSLLIDEVAAKWLNRTFTSTPFHLLPSFPCRAHPPLQNLNVRSSESVRGLSRIISPYQTLPIMKLTCHSRTWRNCGPACSCAAPIAHHYEPYQALLL